MTIAGWALAGIAGLIAVVYGWQYGNYYFQAVHVTKNAMARIPEDISDDRLHEITVMRLDANPLPWTIEDLEIFNEDGKGHAMFTYNIWINFLNRKWIQLPVSMDVSRLLGGTDRKGDRYTLPGGNKRWGGYRGDLVTYIEGTKRMP